MQKASQNMQNLQNLQESFRNMQDFQIETFWANNWSTFASRNRKNNSINQYMLFNSFKNQESMTKIKEKVKDWKDFILLCVTVVLIAGCFFISKMFDFFVIHQKKEGEAPIRSYLKTTNICYHNPIEA